MALKRDVYEVNGTFICESVTIVKTRWEVKITIHRSDQDPVVLVASADAALTDNDGIWFGTKQEYDKWET